MIKSIFAFIIIVMLLRYVARLFQVTNSPQGGGQQQRTDKQPYIKVEREEPLHHKKDPHHTTEDAEYIEYEEVDDK